VRNNLNVKIFKQHGNIYFYSVQLDLVQPCFDTFEQYFEVQSSEDKSVISEVEKGILSTRPPWQ